MSSTACDDQHKPDLHDMQDTLGDAWARDRRAVIDEMAREVCPTQWAEGGHMRYKGHTIAWGEYVTRRHEIEDEEEFTVETWREREFNPTTSSLTHGEALFSAVTTGLCADGSPCGSPPEPSDDAYCTECPNRPASDPGRKFDQEKPRFDLLLEGMPRALEEVARVLTFGSIKYEDHNWMLVSRAEHRYLAAGMRHEVAYQRGEPIDPDSGLHHLAHKLCCDLFRLELLLREGD